MRHVSRCKCLSVKHAKYFLLRIVPDRGPSTFINADEGSIRSKWHHSYLSLASFNFLNISLRIFVRNEKKEHLSTSRFRKLCNRHTFEATICW